MNCRAFSLTTQPTECSAILFSDLDALQKDTLTFLSSGIENGLTSALTFGSTSLGNGSAGINEKSQIIYSRLLAW